MLFYASTRNVLDATMTVAKDPLKQLSASIAVEAVYHDDHSRFLVAVDINALGRGM